VEGAFSDMPRQIIEIPVDGYDNATDYAPAAAKMGEMLAVVEAKKVQRNSSKITI